MRAYANVYLSFAHSDTDGSIHKHFHSVVFIYLALLLLLSSLIPKVE